MAVQYLISTENLKKKGLIHQNTDVKLLRVAIQRTQDRVIQPALGSPLYRELLDRVAGNTAWTATYRTLMDDYVTPALVASVDAKIVKLGTQKITNKGTGTHTDENFTNSPYTELSMFQDELDGDAGFYLERLIGFLRDDAGSDYPEYTEAITRILSSVIEL